MSEQSDLDKWHTIAEQGQWVGKILAHPNWNALMSSQTAELDRQMANLQPLDTDEFQALTYKKQGLRELAFTMLRLEKLGETAIDKIKGEVAPKKNIGAL